MAACGLRVRRLLGRAASRYLNFVPYIGSFLGVLFPVIMAIVQFGNLTSVLLHYLLLPLTVIQFVIGNFLDPYIMGNSLNLSPFALSGQSGRLVRGLWGIPGAFLAVPITAIMAIIFSEFTGTRPLAVLLSRNGRIGCMSYKAVLRICSKPPPSTGWH